MAPLASPKNLFPTTTTAKLVELHVQLICCLVQKAGCGVALPRRLKGVCAAKRPELVSVLCQPCQLAWLCRAKCWHDQVDQSTSLPKPGTIALKYDVNFAPVHQCTSVPECTRVYGVNWWHDLDRKTGVPACNNTSCPNWNTRCQRLKRALPT